MNPLLLKRVVEVPEALFAAFLFPFKLFTVCAAFWPLIWYFMLPPNNTSANRIDEAFFMAINDFRVVTTLVGLLYFLSAGVLVIGGFAQLFNYSRKAALWSIGFGILALTIGSVLGVVCDSLPSGHEGLGR